MVRVVGTVCSHFDLLFLWVNLYDTWQRRGTNSRLARGISSSLGVIFSSPSAREASLKDAGRRAVISATYAGV